jgi:hypothetical protein
MEAVLDLYEEAYDEKRPVVCFDERPCQLLAEVREPLAGKPGCPERRDHEYERRGMAHVLLMAFEPLTGWRRTSVRRASAWQGVRPGRTPPRGGSLPGGREDPAGLRQPLHPHGRRLLRDLLAEGRAPAGKEGRVRLHAGSWVVAEHGRDRDLGFG